MILFYIRHGDPIYNPDMLTPLGHRQADAVAKRLALYGVDEVYSSTSIRAMETAEPTCELLKKPLTTLDWMHEQHVFDAFTVPIVDGGRPTWLWSHADYAALICSREVREMGDRWYEHPAFRDLNFHEYYSSFKQNIDDWIATLGYEHDREKGMYKVTGNNKEKRVALFAHEGVGKLFMSELLDIPYPYYVEHFEMKHTGMTVIYFDEGRREYDFHGYARARVLTLSNDSHLFREGLSTYHNSTGMREIY
jgi:probable phosphoglycerate mutase